MKQIRRATKVLVVIWLIGLVSSVNLSAQDYGDLANDEFVNGWAELAGIEINPPDNTTESQGASFQPNTEPTGSTYTDADGDGLSFEEEQALGTDPNNWDSDGDGYPDGYALHDLLYRDPEPEESNRMSYSGNATYIDRAELWTIDVDVNSPTFGEYILSGTIPGEQQWRGTSDIVELGPDWMWEGDEEPSNCGNLKEVEEIDANSMRVTFTDWYEWVRWAIKTITA